MSGFGQERAQSITEVTRRGLLDELRLQKVDWSGRLGEVEFLERIFELNGLPSHDYRFSTATQDIYQHRVRNSDWNADWVYGDPRFELLRCPDSKFLAFLCEMLHPVVRADAEEVKSLAGLFNKHLLVDGFSIEATTHISGRPVFSGRKGVASPLSTTEARQILSRVDETYVARQVTRMEAAIPDDPDLAIGTAKELVETVCKTVLDAHSIPHASDVKLHTLVKDALAVLHLVPDAIPQKEEGASAMRSVLGSLSAITSGISQLRRDYGTGHGKAAGSRGLDTRHARLAVAAAVAFGVFVIETHKLMTQEKRKKMEEPLF